MTLFAPESDAERATRRETLAQRQPVNQGKSNERGAFVVDPRRRGDFDVVVIGDGYLPQLLHASAGKNLGTIKLTAVRELTGSVACKSQPLAGANVLVAARDGIELVATTDRAGHFRVPEPSAWADNVRVVVGGREAASMSSRQMAEGMTISACAP